MDGPRRLKLVVGVRDEDEWLSGKVEDLSKGQAWKALAGGLIECTCRLHQIMIQKNAGAVCTDLIRI